MAGRTPHLLQRALPPPPELTRKANGGHGAAADTFMSHLAVLETLPGGQDPTTWLEPVTDQQYQAAHQPDDV